MEQSEPDIIPEAIRGGQKLRPAVTILLAVILIATFCIRAYRPLSRSQLWPNRAMSFYSAVVDQRWDSTYQSRHPGVTTMAIGALTYFVFDQVEETQLEGLFTWGAPPWANSFGEEVAVGMIGMSLLITLLLYAITLVLRRLGGWTLAISALVLVSFSPFFLAQSRVFHVDALVSTLMLLSALLIILYQESGSWIDLIASGLIGGLALLTKTPAIFLIPFTGLALLTHAGSELARDWAEESLQGRVRRMLSMVLKRIIVPLAIWLVVALLIIPLWPALWEEPLDTLTVVIEGASEHVENAHIKERFFAGRTYINQPPPPTYYPASLLYRTTFISLLFVVISALIMTIWRKRQLAPVKPTVYWLLVAYVVFFTIQMSIGAKQIDRYILPAQMMLDVIAAVGLIGAAKVVSHTLADKLTGRPQMVGSVFLVLSLALHLLVTLPFFPDFGAHYNYLLGGNRGASKLFSFQGQNEGVFDIVKYMREHPDVHIPDAMAPDSIWLQFDVQDKADVWTHELISVVNVRRGLINIERVVDSYADQTPELIVSFDNVIYLWLYRIDEGESLPTMHIRRGWSGFTIVAWATSVLIMSVFALGMRRYPADS